MHHAEQHRAGVGGWLRAAVLGANDGIVSIASLVLGIAAADSGADVVATAGLVGLVGGALSMAAGEYVSVSSQRDIEVSDLARERQELAESPEAERRELIEIYEAKGLPAPLAEQVADALVHGRDPLHVHAREELRLDPDDLARPLQAAVVSAISFGLGAALPLAVIVLTPATLRVLATVAAALVALAVLGSASAQLGRAPVARAVGRVVLGGALAMGLTYGLGAVFNVAI